MSYERRSACRPPECSSTGNRGRSRSNLDEWLSSDGTGEQQGETGDDRLRCADSHEICLRPGKGSQESSTIRSSMVHGKECEVLRSACCSYEDEIRSVEELAAKRDRLAGSHLSSSSPGSPPYQVWKPRERSASTDRRRRDHSIPQPRCWGGGSNARERRSRTHSPC